MNSGLFAPPSTGSDHLLHNIENFHDWLPGNAASAQALAEHLGAYLFTHTAHYLIDLPLQVLEGANDCSHYGNLSADPSHGRVKNLGYLISIQGRDPVG